MMLEISRRNFTRIAAAATLMAGEVPVGESAVDGKRGAATHLVSAAASGLQEAVLSVFDIDQIARPMVEVGGFRLVRLPDAPAAQLAAWHVPPGCSGIEQALLLPPDPRVAGGCLRLVRFHDVPQRVMRSSQRSWDTGGIFDIDVFSSDVERVYRQLQRYGWTALGEPVDYSEAHFSVRQVLAVGPSGLMLAIIQRYSPPVEELSASASMSAVFNSTQMVRDFAQSARFYLEVLDWKRDLEFRIDDAVEPGADVLGLPLPLARSAQRRIGMFRPEGSPRGIVELIENGSMHGREFGQFCVAPNVGLLSLRIPVPDVDRYAAEIVARGGVLYSNRQTFELAPYGSASIFSIRSPEGAILEFFQVINATNR